ncbi:hypothetical protein AKJ09_00909 [Labilithrix luteola]|uniref:RNA polymerase sigma factor RpoE n=1 Tax=Labilithrix luteola TaxID=1391654 RepID=A0A0K1PL51_9BACT|nr:sigma-70 family RNA polymerase sigma factor [Labilithrix luteola]AKU94245.1 hypothetical protein AKJ09_00909 [Labilithrix luteola]
MSLRRVLTRSAASAAAPNLSIRDARESEAERAAPLAARTAEELEREAYLRGMVHEHFTSVWRFLRRLGFEEHVADDAAQDLFFVAFRRASDIRPGRERSFLFGAALRIAMKMKRKERREVPVQSFSPRLEPATNTPTPETLLDDERARELLHRLLSELDERLRVVFVMYELEQMTLPQIAEMLEIPVGTAASRLRSARDDFQARLARHRARARHEGAK